MIRIEQFVLPKRRIPALIAIVAVATFAVVERPSRVVAQSAGLMAAYSFSEGSGTTVADVSGHNLTGTIVGATWTTGGKYGNALSFNGSSSYVDLGNPAALQLTGSMTLEAWVKAAATPPDDGQIIAKSRGAGWQLKTTPDTGPETFGVQVTGTSGTSAQRYTTTARSLNVWYHIAAVYDATAGTLSTYVNGALDNGTLRNIVPTLQVDQAVNVNIGRRADGFYFNGVIDEVRIYNRALSQAEVQTDMNTPIGGTAPPPDTTPPTVSITSPLDGATVVGATNITVNASDNIGVANVQYLLDGANLGNPVTTAPFTFQWNSQSTILGPHTLAAIARDYANNSTTSASISVIVSNPSPAQIGQWSPVLNWPQTGLGIPLVGVHASLLPSGNVLTWSDYSDNSGAQIFRPATNTFSDATFSAVSLFCSAHAFLADGRLLVSGGIVGFQDDLGPQQSETFDPVTETWTPAALMNTGRYYPTTTTLGDGRVLVQGGTTTCVSCIANTPEIYDPVANRWTNMANSAKETYRYYPHSFVLPDGRVIVAGSDDAAISTKVLDLNTQAWTTVDSRIIDGHSSAMYQPGKIIKAGTATADNPGFSSAATAYVLDMTQPSPAWQATGSMAFPRSFLNLTLLPDGNVLATGGGTTTDPADHSKAVYEAEIWSPVTKTWTTMARMQTPRQYHSVALLLPDATVLVAGSGRQNGRSQPDPADEPNSEIFSPPYLFKGPRPIITSAPSKLLYGSSFSVVTPDDARIASVSLIALGSVTHAFNENQRFVPLTFAHAGGSINVTAPVDGNTAPPGPYMLFIVDTNGVPSVAAMVRLPAPSEDVTPPTPPGNLSATASTGSARLAWFASTDNVGVTAYNIHRSTTSGFTPTTANRIGQTAATTYTDAAFTAAGTYYYLVTAQDARGNISAPSNEAPATITLDTTPPTVSITSPAAGATISGVVAVTASASDDVGVVGVQFYLDGSTPLGAEVTAPGPTYSYSWPTTIPLNGPHTLSARARDAAGNATTSPAVAVTISNTVPPNLVAAYSFNEGTGTTVADLSGNNLTGTIVGATWTTGGKYGNALSFNGTSSYVDLGNPTALKLTGSMTVEAWIKATANPADDGEIVAKSNGSGWQLKTTPDTGPETFGIQVTGSSGTAAQRYSTTVRSLTTWYHIAGVYDAAAGTLSTYVNGVLDNGTLRNTVPTAQADVAVNVNIGRRTGGFYFNGIIDEVRIYNRALSQPEIQVDMNTPVGGTPPPADLTVASTHVGTFTQGQTGTYTVTVTNAGSGASSGLVTVADAVPVGLTATAMSGTGWTCTLATTTCTRSDALSGSASYPAITLTVNVASDASSSVTNTATVSGGGETNTANDVSNDITTVTIPDTTPPTVSITSPLQGDVVAGIVVVAATATDNVGVAGVQFLLDGANLGTEVTGPGPGYSVNWNTTALQNGTHTLSARARDAKGNSTSATGVQVTVSNPDTTPPTVAMTSPVNGFTATGIISVMATATDNQAMAGVQFLLDGASLGAEVLGAGPTYTYIWDTTTASNGPHVLSARARDGANLTTTSATVNLIVSNGDTTPPTVAITSPTGGSTLAGSVTITVSATDNVAMAGVQFLLDGANLGAEVLGAGPTYTFSWNTTTVTSGSHMLSARGRDVTNNTAVAPSVNITVSNTLPTGVLAAYSFNAGSGTTAVDSSGNGVTGTIHGATWTTGGKYGNALSFNGTNNYVDLGNPASLKATGSMTWAAWVKATSTPATDGNIVAKQNATSGWQLKTTADTGAQTFAVTVSGTVLRYSNTVPSANTWYHVAGVYSATTRSLDIYVNGVLDDGVLRGTVPTKQTIPNVNVNIGRQSNGLYFPGVIDEVQIYNRALSAAEIQTIMNTPLP